MSHTEKTLQNMIMELAYLLEKREERVAGALAIILDQKMCLHCSRTHLLEWLSLKDVQQYDMVFRPQHWCKCEDGATQTKHALHAWKAQE